MNPSHGSFPPCKLNKKPKRKFHLLDSYKATHIVQYREHYQSYRIKSNQKFQTEQMRDSNACKQNTRKTLAYCAITTTFLQRWCTSETTIHRCHCSESSLKIHKKWFMKTVRGHFPAAVLTFTILTQMNEAYRGGLARGRSNKYWAFRRQLSITDTLRNK